MISKIQDKRLPAIGFFNAEAPAGCLQQMSVSHHLDTIIAGCDIAVWALEVNTMRVNVCETFKRLLSLTEKENYLFVELFRMIDSANRESFIKNIRISCASPDAFNFDFMLRDQSELGYRWFKLSGRAYSQALNHKGNYMGTLTDITAAKTKEIWNNDRLALLSHELKGPLSVIRLYLQRAGKINSQTTILDAALFLTKADDQVSAMAELMDDFLSFSTAGYIKMKLSYECFDIASIVDDLVVQMRMKHPGYQFVAKIPSAINIRADKRKIVQVIQNYLSNAVKYSSKNSLIEVKCKRNNGCTVLCVSDTGLGIQPEFQEKVFERYYRTPGTHAEGFGLGLYLVKEIISEHGGKVWVESTINKGSDFYFSIPQSSNNFKSSIS